MYQVYGSDFQATLRAISEAGKLEVLSRPSILARNNQQATITVGQEIPLVTNTRFDTLGNQINTISYQDVGIILKVTPFITSDGMVQMIVSPQISELSSKTIPISSGPGGAIGAPVIDLRSADTVVVTPDSKTVIIGGLMQTQKTSTESKVPLLGDIPLLGAAFRHKVQQEVKTELMIFLTPIIVKDPGQLASLSETERLKAKIPPKAFTEEELNQFLDRVPNKSPAPEPKK
jgi:general secretion pathway protein D